MLLRPLLLPPATLRPPSRPFARSFFSSSSNRSRSNFISTKTSTTRRRRRKAQGHGVCVAFFAPPPSPAPFSLSRPHKHLQHTHGPVLSSFPPHPSAIKKPRPQGLADQLFKPALPRPFSHVGQNNAWAHEGGRRTRSSEPRPDVDDDDEYGTTLSGWVWSRVIPRSLRPFCSAPATTDRESVPPAHGVAAFLPPATQESTSQPSPPARLYSAPAPLLRAAPFTHAEDGLALTFRLLLPSNAVLPLASPPHAHQNPPMRRRSRSLLLVAASLPLGRDDATQQPPPPHTPYSSNLPQPAVVPSFPRASRGHTPPLYTSL